MRKPPLRNHRQPYSYSVGPVQQHRWMVRPRVIDNHRVESAFVAGDESFAELFEASLKSESKAVARRDPELGELVQGEIVQLGAEFAFLDIGGKAEAMIALDELRGEDGELTVGLGDKLEGHVISVGGKEGGLIISGRLQRGTGLSDQLRQAYQQGAPVQGLATGVNKGGLDIDLGGVRAFLPSSQIELRYCQEPSIYIGRALTLRVIRYDENSRTVVVSRRAVLEVEQRELAERTRSQLHVGAVFTGTLVALPENAALVDIGGLDGSVPLGELHAALRAIGRDEDALKVGQRVEVEVGRLETTTTPPDHWLSSLQGNIRISLSLRKLLADPLDEMLARLHEGQHVTGRVVRLEPFGAFVELAPSVEGLIHISSMAERHISHPREILTLGQELTATVISLDRERRRIGLSLIEELRAAQAAVAATLAIGSRVRARVERVESNGVLVRVQVPGVAESTYPRGLIPHGELNVPRGSDLKRLFPVGREHTAAVQLVDGEGRVRLSLRAALNEEPVSEPSTASHTTPSPVPSAVSAEVAAAAAAPPAAPAAEPAPAKPKTSRAKKAAPASDAAAAPAEATAPAPAERAKPSSRSKPPVAVVSETERAKPSSRSKPPAASSEAESAKPSSRSKPPAAASEAESAPSKKSVPKPRTVKAKAGAAEPAAAAHAEPATATPATAARNAAAAPSEETPAKKRVRKTA